MSIAREMASGLVVLLILLWLPSDSGAQGAAQKPCGCTKQDKLDLESRIKQTQAAIHELNRMIKGWEQKEKGGSDPSITLEEGGTQNEMSAEEFREKMLMKELAFHMFPAQIKGSRVYGAVTDPACDVIINPSATPCLRGALADHEGVHAKACKANKGLNPFIDWRSSQRIVDYLKEEREGYQKEQDRLTKELDSQTKQCSTVTQLDRSEQQLLQGMLAQRDRLNQANNRLLLYGSALN
jgi:hypothetical protein